MDGPFYFRSSTRRYRGGGGGPPHIFPNRVPTFVNPALQPWAIPSLLIALASRIDPGVTPVLYVTAWQRLSNRPARAGAQQKVMDKAVDQGRRMRLDACGCVRAQGGHFGQLLQHWRRVSCFTTALNTIRWARDVQTFALVQNCEHLTNETIKWVTIY